MTVETHAGIGVQSPVPKPRLPHHRIGGGDLRMVDQIEHECGAGPLVDDLTSDLERTAPVVVL